MKHQFRLGAVALAICALTVSLTGCVAESGPAASDRVCVVLPDADPTGRWELIDRPALDDGAAAGELELDVRSADGTGAGLAAAAAELLAGGCGVLVLTDVDGAAASVAADAGGVPVVAYDRPFAGASHVVAFDAAEIGRLQGQSLVDAFAAAARDAASAIVVYLAPSDLDATAREGALTALRAGGVRPASEPLIGDGTTPQAAFERALAGLSGRVDAVWAADDASAGAAAEVLSGRGAAPVPIAGGVATPDALRRILAGWQTSAVQLPIDEEVQALLDVVTTIVRPDASATPAPDAATTVLIAPLLVTATELPALVSAGVVSAGDLCAGDVLGVVLADRCSAAGIG